MAPLSIIFLTEFNKTRLNICLILLQDYIHKILFAHKIFFVIYCGFLKHWANNSNRHFYLRHIHENLLSWQFFQHNVLVFTWMRINTDVSCDLYIIGVAGWGSQHPFRPLRAVYTWHTADTLTQIGIAKLSNCWCPLFSPQPSVSLLSCPCLLCSSLPS